MSDFSKIKLPPGSRTFSGDIILERRGGKMWDELKRWIEEQTTLGEYLISVYKVEAKMSEIEERYGIDYVAE